MKNSYALLVVMALSVATLLTGLPVVGQTIPTVQWTKLGANLTATTDGNLVASLDGLPAGQIAGQGVVKYTSAGNPVWTTLLKGYTDLAGRLGLGKAPFQYVDNMAATTDGGVVVFGREFGSGLGVLAKLNAAGLQSDAFVLPRSVITIDALLGTPDGGFLVVITAFASFTETHKDTFVYKYTSQGTLSWSRQIAYPNASPGNIDQSITKAEAALNALGGGYLLAGYYSAVGPANTIPATDFDPVPNSAHASGWVAKINDNGTVAWQQLPAISFTFRNDGPEPGALAHVNTFTDVVMTPDGTGYALAGAGIGPSSLVLPPPVACIIELSADGTVKRGLSNGLAPTKAFLKLYTSGGLRYYAIGTTSLLNGADPLLALINPADLSKVITQRIFDSPSNTSLRGLTIASDGSLGFSTSQEVYKLGPADPPGPGLTIVPPTYDCSTGQLTINVVGAGNAPLEYQILGLRVWGPSPVFTVPAYQRIGTPFLLETRQGGSVASASFVSNCAAPVTSGLTLLPPVFDCNTGQLTLQTNTVGSSVEFRVIGLRDWGSSPIFMVPAYQRLNTTFNLEARLTGGPGVQLPFTTTCGTPPPAGTDLVFAPPTLICATGGGAQLVVNLAGIAFAPTNGIEYKVPGLADWQLNNAFAVPFYQTRGTTFTLFARRINTQQSFTTQFTANCLVGSRQATGTEVTKLEATVYPNPVGEQFTIEVRGAAQQAVCLELSDALGHPLQSRWVTVPDNRHQEIIRLPASASGLYLLRVSTRQQAVTVKVIKP